MGKTLRETWVSAGGTLARRLFFDRQAEFWLGELDPLRSFTETRARVDAVLDETPDTKTFVLRPNSAWRGHRAGQHTLVTVEIDGVRVRRCYSLSSAPGAARVSITVKRVPGGRVSNWLHDRVRVGDAIRLEPATGDFVLPRFPGQLLLLSAGSGITPVMSMLRDLVRRDAVHNIVFVHYARSLEDLIFGAELREFDAALPGLRVAVCLDDDLTTPRGFDERHFTQLVPDFAERATFLCGPPGLMQRVEGLWESVGASRRLASERFVVTAPRAAVAPGSEVQVTLAASGRDVRTDGMGTLLEQLERAGERPAHGCRMGICRTCRCTKRSGTVHNFITGETSSEPDQEIQLCVTVPRSDLELEL